jgi:hypothetical protein
LYVIVVLLCLFVVFVALLFGALCGLCVVRFVRCAVCALCWFWFVGLMELWSLWSCGVDGFVVCGCGYGVKEVSYMPKMCKCYPDRRCFHNSCNSLDIMGNVVICSLHPNPSGFFSERKVVPILHGVFDKHSLRRKGVVS